MKKVNLILIALVAVVGLQFVGCEQENLELLESNNQKSFKSYSIAKFPTRANFHSIIGHAHNEAGKYFIDEQHVFNVDTLESIITEIFIANGMDATTKPKRLNYDELLRFADSTYEAKVLFDSLIISQNIDIETLPSEWYVLYCDLIPKMEKGGNISEYIKNETNLEDEALQMQMLGFESVYDSSSSYWNEVNMPWWAIPDGIGAAVGGIYECGDQWRHGEWDDGFSGDDAWDIAWSAVIGAAAMSFGGSPN